MSEKRVLSVSLVLLLLSALAAGESFAQEEGGFFGRLRDRFSNREAKKEAPAPAPVKEETPEPRDFTTDMSDKDIINEITETLKRYGVILEIIPGLSMDEDRSGGAYYMYKQEGKASRRLEELDRDTLENLYFRVMGEGNRLHTDSVLRQIQATKIPGQQVTGPPSMPTMPPTLPKPPQLPQGYSNTSPLQPPRTHTGPPQLPPPPPPIPDTEQRR
jgi:hypothetical protein